ncbi:hypothetical protein [Glaciibacter superstes]|uniref:hypothetical protein n=1 Tax=Glaciibacter superstes TaxID=501023 RepID=UPI0004032051|nr:hypothetical protein [Glaciibacter superstes]
MPAVAHSPDASGTVSNAVASNTVASNTAASNTVASLQQRISSMQATKLDTRTLPTLEALAGILPGGSLRQGAAYSVDSTSLVMALLAGPSQSGAWCGVVGVPDFGTEAAASFGIDLTRLVLVPSPADQWLTVTAALVDVLTVVVVSPPRGAADADVARLSARMRQRGCTLIVMGAWPQVEASLHIEHSQWNGLAQGYGFLSGREVTITSTGKHRFDRPKTASLWLPDAQQNIRTVEPSPPASVHPASPRSAPARPVAVPPLRETG